MVLVTIVCCVVGDGSVVPVEIETSKLVGLLKEVIAEKLKYTGRADKVQLFLAKTKDGAWLVSDGPDVISMRSGTIPEQVDELLHEQIDPAEEFGDLFGGAPTKKVIHVLVVVPERVVEDGAWSAKDLSNVDPQVQSKMWQSVVRVSSEDVCSGTTLVVDRTPTHLYLLTNLHLWVDATFTDHLSADFKNEIKRYLRLHPKLKTSGRKRKGGDVAMQPSRKSPRKSAKKTPVVSDKPQVVVEQLLSNAIELDEVHRFSLDSDICWRSSAAFDFAIFEVAVPQDIHLVRCKMAVAVFATMSVHVFGFPGALQDHKFDHPYAIIPAEVTGWSGNKMTLSSLSAPGLSGSGIVCTKRGVPVGYIGGGFDGLAKKEQYQSYGFTFHGIPPDLPSSLPPVTEGETKDEL